MVAGLYKRKVYESLLTWKRKSDGKTAVMVEGARRVGKSTVVGSFAENEYRSYILIDFSDPKHNTEKLISEGIGQDFDRFFMKLQLSESVTLFPRESVIVFDEVQLFPKARQMIKHLVADGRYDYIETGSLISIRKNVSGIVIPSEETRITMHPMDFEEYLWAAGDMNTIPYIRTSFENREPLGRVIHEAVMERYREYMIVGGMPQVVGTFLDTKNLEKTDAVKRMILDLYVSDIGKISTKTGVKIERIFTSIPALLSRHDKTFSPGEIESDTRTRDYLDSITWLNESKTVNVCHACTDPGAALMLNIDDKRFKCYMADTGLLITMSSSGGLAVPEMVYRSLLFDKLSIDKGMFFENMVAQELVCTGHNLVFSVFKTEGSESMYEVDFLITKGAKVIPIEVKSNVSGKHASLDMFMKKYHKRLGECFVIHSKDLKTENGITYIPIYMTMFL